AAERSDAPAAELLLRDRAPEGTLDDRRATGEEERGVLHHHGEVRKGDVRGTDPGASAHGCGDDGDRAEEVRVGCEREGPEALIRVNAAVRGHGAAGALEEAHEGKAHLAREVLEI